MGYGPHEGGRELRQKLLEWAALTCSCGHFFTWAEYLELEKPANGDQQPTTDDNGRAIILILRNCKHCHSTMGRTKPPGATP